jgi:hypothetical protein
MLLGILCCQCGHDIWETVGNKLWLPYMQCSSPHCIERKNPYQFSFCHLCSSRINHISNRKMRYHNSLCSKIPSLVQKDLNNPVSTSVSCLHCAFNRWTKVSVSMGMSLMRCLSPQCIGSQNRNHYCYFGPICLMPFNGNLSRQKIRSYKTVCSSSTNKATDKDDDDDTDPHAEGHPLPLSMT